MSVFEYEYSNRDRQLVVGQEDNFNFGVKVWLTLPKSL